MSLAAGTKLGPYEVLSPIGAGGMGEVYRARDSRLDRTVAIKVLHTAVTPSADALARFEREARSVSQLSHPHICPLFDVGEEGGIRFLVMPLLDGETLAALLLKAPLPPTATLRYATQMADALDAAHRAGLVHRDLKPANVMVTKSGVKLLDFGLAKTSSTASAGMATVGPVTAEGALVGTFQYMAPELLEGRAADHRSDIWALGAVIYEMATGERLFKSTPLVILPAALDRLVRTCLAVDPDDRWQSARDVSLQLAGIASSGDVEPVQPRGPVAWWPWAFVAASLAFGAVALLRPGSGTPVAPRVIFDVPPPEGGDFIDSVETIGFALSPDGSQLAYLAADAAGGTSVWLRPLSSFADRSVPGTEGARSVFWSPDSRSIGFFARGKLMRLDLPDGSPITIADVPDVRAAATWGDGAILFAVLPTGIYRVSLSGGKPVLEVAPDHAKAEVSAGWPAFLPDGRRYLYVARTGDDLAVVRLAEPGKPPRDIMTALSTVQYLDRGIIAFARDGALFGQNVDAQSLAVVGEPFPIAEPVRYFLSTGAASFTASRTGVLAYQRHLLKGRIVWLDRAGKESGSIGDSTVTTARARISPDGTRVVFDRTQPRTGTYDLWTYDIDRAVEQSVTSARMSEISGVWLRGANAIIYSGGVPPHLIRRDLTTGTEKVLLSSPGFDVAEDTSPDGKTVVFRRRTLRGTFDIWSATLGDSPSASPIVETPFDEASVRFSPDGRHIAFESDESGRYEVYIATFPNAAVKTRVSTAGGSLPRWSRDGHELFFVAADRHLMSVPVSPGVPIALGSAAPLFDIPAGSAGGDFNPNNGWTDFDPSPDGKRFLAVVPEPAGRKPVTVMMGWMPRTTGR